MTSTLTAEDIGSFTPNPKDEFINYRDVYRFKQRIEESVTYSSDIEVRALIPACLRGDALT